MHPKEHMDIGNEPGDDPSVTLYRTPHGSYTGLVPVPTVVKHPPGAAPIVAGGVMAESPGDDKAGLSEAIRVRPTANCGSW